MPDCSELKRALIHVLSGLTYMSNDVIRKSGTYLDEVELLDSKSVEPITKNVRTLLERININLSQFGVTFDTALEKYKIEQDVEKAKVVDKPTLNSIVNANSNNEDCPQQPPKPGPSSEDSIKEEQSSSSEHDGKKCDEFMDAMGIVLKQECEEVSKSPVTKQDFESSHFDFVSINDVLEGDMKMEENGQDAESELLDSDDDAIEIAEIGDTWKPGYELPARSKERYEAVYKVFKLWADSKNLPICEKTLLGYFLARGVTLKSPASLWMEYSMLRATININHGIDISKYTRLFAFLKKKNIGYRPKKSKAFTKDEMIKFLKEAPDDWYLMMKVVMILGIMGACRRKDLTYMKRGSIKDCGTVIFVTLPSPKTYVPRTVTISNHFYQEVDMLGIFRKYVDLLPHAPPSGRFFYNFRNGKCLNQVVGVNTMGKIPAKIAQYLNLPNPNSYTGLAFRRSSATMMAIPQPAMFATEALSLQ